jgi:hypothetical protein
LLYIGQRCHDGYTSTSALHNQAALVGLDGVEDCIGDLGRHGNHGLLIEARNGGD